MFKKNFLVLFFLELLLPCHISMILKKFSRNYLLRLVSDKENLKSDFHDFSFIFSSFLWLDVKIYSIILLANIFNFRNFVIRQSFYGRYTKQETWMIQWIMGMFELSIILVKQSLHRRNWKSFLLFSFRTNWILW